MGHIDDIYARALQLVDSYGKDRAAGGAVRSHSTFTDCGVCGSVAGRPLRKAAAKYGLGAPVGFIRVGVVTHSHRVSHLCPLMQAMEESSKVNVALTLVTMKDVVNQLLGKASVVEPLVTATLSELAQQVGSVP
jgi:hypothetical protein